MKLSTEERIQLVNLAPSEEVLVHVVRPVETHTIRERHLRARADMQGLRREIRRRRRRRNLAHFECLFGEEGECGPRIAFF